MKNAYAAGAAAVLILAGVADAGAQSLKVRQEMADQEELLAEHVKNTNKACETAIAVQFNWKGVPEDKIAVFSASGYCDGAMGAIRSTCETGAGKAAVKEKIKTLTCGFGAQRAVSLKDGALSYSINFEANDKDYIYKFLQDNL